MRIITVSREFGSGGRELGKRLADHLGYHYFDREIVTAIAQKTALDETYVETVLEKGLFKTMPITFGHTFSYLPSIPYDGSNLFTEQQKVIRELAAHGDCVMLGRNADMILENEHPFKLFIYADMDAKIRRCRQRAPDGEHLTEREMEKQIRRIDKARANYHDLLADTAWGDKSSYHLCVNTTGVPLETLVPAIANYAKAWFEAFPSK